MPEKRLMRLILYILFALIGLFFTVLLGFDGVYVGLLASEEELSQYPWGTELGWTYLNKTNYMFSGLLIAGLSWLPFLVFMAIMHLTRRSGKDELTRTT
jgi:hypothetical protein